MLCWEPTPAGILATQLCPPFVDDITLSGHASRQCGPNGTWEPNHEVNATDGWTNYTDCFKADPVMASISNDLSRIQLMSEIGYGISLAALIIAVFIMVFARRFKSKSNTLHLNLFVAFIMRAVVAFLKSILFVDGIGLEKDVLRLPDGTIEFRHEGQHWGCKLIVSVFMYTVAASLSWIFMEGLYLHMLVYKTLFVERSGVRLYVIIGWASPLLYIVPWMFVRKYLEDDICWNTYSEIGYVWIIKGPIILTILVNFIFFMDIVRVLCLRMKSHRNNKEGNHQLRKIAKFSLVLIPLFGVLYIGFAAYPVGIDVHADIVYLYCEMFYNSFQGLVLAILFCFLNEEVHNEIRRCYYRRRRQNRFGTRTFTLTTKGSCASQTYAAASMIQQDSSSDKLRKYTERHEDNTKLYSFDKSGQPDEPNEHSGMNGEYKLIENSDFRL